MKRKRISLLCAILSVTMVILLCPPIAFAEDAIPDAKMLSYEDYFENEHGFYLDTITKSKQYLNMSTGLFSPLVQKEANGTITRNGQEVTGIIGNSEIVFFAIDHTVYRYHVKSKRIDAVFTEPMMESFYPITSLYCGQKLQLLLMRKDCAQTVYLTIAFVIHLMSERKHRLYSKIQNEY